MMGSAGAIMELLSGDTKVYRETWSTRSAGRGGAYRPTYDTDHLPLLAVGPISWVDGVVSPVHVVVVSLAVYFLPVRALLLFIWVWCGTRESRRRREGLARDLFHCSWGRPPRARGLGRYRERRRGRN